MEDVAAGMLDAGPVAALVPVADTGIPEVAAGGEEV